MHMLFIQDLQNHASSPLNKHNRTFGNWTFIHSLIEKGFHPDPHIRRCSWDQKAAVLRVVNPSPLCPWLVGPWCWPWKEYVSSPLPKDPFVLLMEEFRLTFWYGKYPIIYRVLYIRSQVVVWDFFRQQYVLRIRDIPQNQSYDLGMGCFNQNQSYKKSEGVWILRTLCGICMKQLGWMFGELQLVAVDSWTHLENSYEKLDFWSMFSCMFASTQPPRLHLPSNLQPQLSFVCLGRASHEWTQVVGVWNWSIWGWGWTDGTI